MKLRAIIPSVAFMLLAGTASSAELLLNDVSGKAGRIIGLDAVFDGKAVGFQANLKIADTSKVNLDLSNCLAKLPKTHVGSCKINSSGEVVVLVYSANNTPLGEGLVSIGQIGLKSSNIKSAISVQEFLVSDSSGNALDAKHSIQ